MKRTRNEPTERVLSALLDALALVLVKLGITPARLAHVARASFVKAGVRYTLKRSSGRPHLARIAALTGLSRSEVKRIVAANFSSRTSKTDSSPRAMRVLAAWKRAKNYSRRGKPIKINIDGRAPSFVALCHDHSGDIPYRVILDALEEGGLVKLDKRRTQVSVSRRPPHSMRPSAEFTALSFAAALLEEALNEDTVIVRKRQRIRTSSAVPTGYVEKAVANRVTEFMEQIPNLFPASKRRGKDGIEIFAVVARNRKSKD